MKSCAVLLAAGNSVRMGENKMLMKIHGKTAVERCLEVFSKQVDEIVIAVSEAARAAALAAAKQIQIPVKAVHGGKRRQDSVYNAITATEADIVCIHDCARCLIDGETVRASLESAERLGCGIASVPVTDTLRNARTGEIADRSALLAAQTPQSFNRMKLLEAYKNAPEGDYTDDAALFYAAGNELYYTAGNIQNVKLTYKSDIPLFEAILNERESKFVKQRIGFGEDTHKFQTGRPLILGGVNIPFEKGLAGHSDADALTHALIDAVLGACALGDIGMLFPDSAPEYKGISSLELAERVSALIKEKGFGIENLDSTVIAQTPKLSPYREQMRIKLAKAFNIPVEYISVKFTTPEKLGFEGRSEGITARAAALVSETIKSGRQSAL